VVIAGASVKRHLMLSGGRLSFPESSRSVGGALLLRWGDAGLRRLLPQLPPDLNLHRADRWNAALERLLPRELIGGDTAVYRLQIERGCYVR